jgi:hypothetical protein
MRVVRAVVAVVVAAGAAGCSSAGGASVAASGAPSTASPSVSAQTSAPSTPVTLPTPVYPAPTMDQQVAWMQGLAKLNPAYLASGNDQQIVHLGVSICGDLSGRGAFPTAQNTVERFSDPSTGLVVTTDQARAIDALAQRTLCPDDPLQ